MTRLLVSAKIAPCSETDGLAVRHACDVAEDGQIWRESYAPDCWLVGGDGAKVTLGHDGPVIGSVALVIAHRHWHVADLMLEVTAEQREQFGVGHGVSIDARSLRRDDDLDLGIRRHKMVKLDAVAIVAGNERPIFPEAKIVSIAELRERRAAKVAALDPDLANVELHEGDLVIDHQKGVAHRYEGGRLVRV